MESIDLIKLADIIINSWRKNYEDIIDIYKDEISFLCWVYNRVDKPWIKARIINILKRKVAHDYPGQIC
jgi:hypothetical protein